ncbi:hypothetical protein NMG60_11007777 [Bertholletia excelsa]
MCNCFVKGDMQPSCDTLWRLKPDISLVHLPGKQCSKIVAMNSGMRFHAKTCPGHALGSRMEEAYCTLRPSVSPSGKDNDKIVKCIEDDSLGSKQFVSGLSMKSEFYSQDGYNACYKDSDINARFSERDQPVEEPWLLHFSSCYHAADTSADLMDEDKILEAHLSDHLETESFDQSTLKIQPDSKHDIALGYSEWDQPVEEPWLSDSYLSVSNPKIVSDDESVKDEAIQTKFYGQDHQVTETLLPEEESNAVSQEGSLSTVILINSSVCTMQRIAVLEDGKLVELLLEPVKNNVQCDSVYLGIVTKLVPHMGGAFVNIGSPRPSLMDIKHNREPFIFPPFRRSKMGKKVNDSAFATHEDHAGDDEFQNNSHHAELIDEIGMDEIDDDSVQFLHDEYADHDIEEDFDIQEALEENVNGSLLVIMSWKLILMPFHIS